MMPPSQKAFFVGAVTLLYLHLATAQTSAPQRPTAAELVKAVIHTELNLPDRNIRWKYLLSKEADGKQETREVIETKAGSLDRLVAVSGKPLTDAQARAESDRILRLTHDSAEQRKLEQARRKDAEQCNAFLKMIPDAFLFEYAGQTGGLVRVTFKPNPNFQPPTREAKVLHEMAGDIWVEPKQQRLGSINGQLLSEVKFGGGLLGHLEKGGTFTVRRRELAEGDWEMTEMSVNMQGKALLFKSIAVQQKEVHSNFERVPEEISLPEAAGVLLHQTVVAKK